MPPPFFYRSRSAFAAVAAMAFSSVRSASATASRFVERICVSARFVLCMSI